MLGSSIDVLSLEGISHRANTKLFSDVVSAFELIRNSDHQLTGRRKDKALLEEAKIEALVRYHTGLSITFKTGADFGINAYVLPPHLDKNHPLLSEIHRYYYSNADAQKRIKEAKGSIKGGIDLSTGKVTGVYTQVNSEIFVAAQILQGDLFTSEEAAAVFLHEVGHLMTYYEYLGRHVLMNHVMEDVHKAYTDTGTDKQRVELLEVVKEALDLDDLDAELAVKVKKEETFRTLIVSEVANQSHSATGTKYYDLRTFEALADQYVSRLGGGRYIVTGLDKIHRYYGVRGYESNVQFLIIETFKTIGFIVYSPLILLFMALVEMPIDIYDPPKDRFDRVRRDMVATMKDPKLDSDYRKRLKDDVEHIEKLINEIKDRPDAFMFIWKLIRPSLKNQMNRAQLIQELEELKDNQLFVRYNTLKTLTS